MTALHAFPRSVPAAGALAALVEVRACGAPRMRALAQRLQGRQVGVIGTADEAARAVAAGLAVTGCCAPPLGSVPLAGSALRAAFRRVPRDGSLLAVGPRARAAAAALGVRSAPPDDDLPAPVGALPRESVRESWGVGATDFACLALASPAAACDARAALDVVGRTGIAGGQVVLVVHPRSGELDRADTLDGAPGAPWRIVLDERADDPELLAAAVDAAILAERRIPPDEFTEEAGAAPRAWTGSVRSRRPGLVSAMAAFVRGGAPEATPADRMGLSVALRAGIPVVVAEGVAGGAEALVPAEHRYPRLRPNIGARALQAIRSAASR